MIRALFAGLWLMSAAFLVGYFLCALIAWWREELRVILFRRRVNRRDRQGIARRDSLNQALGGERP